MDKKNTDSNKIVSLQALRAIAFIGIFLSHAGAPFSWPALGVSVFYVLSGFLMFYRHKDDDLDYSLNGRVHYSLARIKKLYPLHILTTICAVFPVLAALIQAGFSFRSLFLLLIEIILNILLLQAWVPDSTVNVSLNGVAWYLSVMLFLNFMFPQIQRFIKGSRQNTLWLICIGILLAECILCIPMILLFGNESPVYIWFMYCFPVFRLGDFFTGCTLGKYYFCSSKTEMLPIKQSIVEVIMTAITVLVFEWLKYEQSNVILLSLHNWTTLFIPIAAIWVYLFVLNSGFITKMLTNKLLIFIGNMSPYTFLIHYVVTRYINSTLSFLKITLSGSKLAFVILLEFTVSVALAVIYKKSRISNQLS